ncbi:fimbrial biogenesis chaperone [Deinococcus sp. PESE-13]
MSVVSAEFGGQFQFTARLDPLGYHPNAQVMGVASQGQHERGLRKKPGADELTYRLQVRQQELPNNDDASAPNVGGAGTSLNLVLSFSLPVYIAPSSAAAKISYAVTRDTGDLLLKMTNAGNRHETYNNFVAERGGRQATLNSWAVLKNSDVTVRLSELGSATGPLTLSFTNARGEKVHETLALP